MLLFTRKNRAGFTLIELLVVIAIIAILAAILFPVFARAREAARKATCQSNLKEVVLGLKMYMDDFDHRVPSSQIRGSTTTVPDFCTTMTVFPPVGVTLANQTIASVLAAYVKSRDLFFCPSDPDNTAAAGNKISYFYRTAVDAGACAGFGNESSFEYPASQMVFVDKLGFHNGQAGDGWIDGVKLNCGFIDGHVDFKAAKGTVATANGATAANIKAGNATALNAAGWPMFYNWDSTGNGASIRVNTGVGINPTVGRDELN